MVKIGLGGSVAERENSKKLGLWETQGRGGGREKRSKVKLTTEGG